MFKLKFELKQHTPIIHFQHEQDGATLRATEVKPKLDRFLLERLGAGNLTEAHVLHVARVTDASKRISFDKFKNYDAGVELAKHKGWLIGDTNALNYKMRFDGQMKNTPEEIGSKKKFPCFFANMGPEWEANPKKFIFSNALISGRVDCFIQSLKEMIDNDLFLFFLKHNFGMRQSKGFGSFTVVPQKGIKSESYSGYQLKISSTVQEKGYKALFERIDLFYRCLRQGINQKNGGGKTIFYFKSLLVVFFHETVNSSQFSTTWEKAAIKERFHSKNTSMVKATDIRDMLGFSTQEAWKNQNFTVTKESDDAARMPSPLLFKPYFEGNSWVVNLVFRGIPDEFKNTTISVKTDKASGLELKPWSDFELESFFEWIIKNYNSKDSIEQHIMDYDTEDDGYERHEYYTKTINLFLNLSKK